MAMAADLVIVEADNLVEAGTIKPENVMTPGIVGDFIVDGGEALRTVKRSNHLSQSVWQRNCTMATS